MTAPGRRARITALVVAGLGLVQFAWIIALVPYFGIDEFDHGLRMSSVAEGRWKAGGTGTDLPADLGRGDLVRVRSDVAASVRAACLIRPYTLYFNCTPYRDYGDGTVEIASAAARYDPLYYEAVGTLTTSWHGDANLYAARAVSALFCTAFVGLAVWILLGLSRTRWPLFALLLTLTPTTVYSSTVIAPNGLEMCAAVCLWVSLVALVRGPDGDGVSGRDRTVAYVATAAALIVVANTHTLGLLMAAMTGAALALWLGIRKVLTAVLPKRPIEYLAILGAVSGVGFNLWWLATSGVNNADQDLARFSGSGLGSVLTGALVWPLQSVGAFPMRDEPAPPIVYGLWITCLLVLGIAAIRSIGVRSRATLTVVAIAGASYVLPSVLTLRTYHQLGAAWQGRYGLPFAVGLIFVIGFTFDQRSPEPVRATSVLLGFGIGALALSETVGTFGMIRQERQFTFLTALRHWNAPAPILIIGCGVLAFLCWGAAAAQVRSAVRAGATPVP